MRGKRGDDRGRGGIRMEGCYRMLYIILGDMGEGRKEKGEIYYKIK